MYDVKHVLYVHRVQVLKYVMKFSTKCLKSKVSGHFWLNGAFKCKKLHTEIAGCDLTLSLQFNNF